MASEAENRSSQKHSSKMQKHFAGWGCSSTELVRISPQQARISILGGKGLENVEVEELNLCDCEISEPVTIDNCRIGRLHFEGAVVKDTLLIKCSTLFDEVVFSGGNKENCRETIFRNDVILQDVEIQGPFSCVKAMFGHRFSCRGKFGQKAIFNHSTFEGNADFDKSIFAKELEYVQCRFAGTVSLREMQCQGYVSMRKAVFEKKMNARHTQFCDAVRMTSAVFLQRAGFNSVHCFRQVEFDYSSFDGEFSTKGAVYEGNLSFRFCQAQTRMLFQNSKFHAQVVLHKLQLNGPLRMPEITIAGKMNMSDAHLLNEIDFTAAKFSGPLFCRNSILGIEAKYAKFTGAYFEKEVDFENSSFPSSVDFERAVFIGKTSFRKTTLGSGEGLVSFKEAQFKRRTGFERTHFVTRVIFNNCVFNRRVGFDRADFDHLASFVEVIFSEQASFRDVQFLKQAFFYATRFGIADFTSAEFEGAARFAIEKHIKPEQQMPCSFSGPAIFVNTRFLKQAMFQKVSFQEQASFNNAYFGEQASFYYAQFGEDAVFVGVFCSLELDLRGIAVKGELMLKGANINRRLNLADAKFSGLAFYNMVTDTMALTPQQLQNKLRGEAKNIRDVRDLQRTAQEYLLLKNSFAYQGMHEEEDWAYWNFRRVSRRAASRQAWHDKKFFTLIKNFIERIFIDYGSRYGTHPLRITVLACFLIAGFGLFYWCFAEQIILEGKEIEATQIVVNGNTVTVEPIPTLVQCIYFSIMAFTTMGFGDVHPDFHGWLKGVVAFEALIGIIIMTLFVGTYARKIIR